MFRKIIIVSAACLAIAGSLSAAPAVHAQEDRQTYEEFCRQMNANAGLDDGMSQAAQAMTELRQAGQLEDLARSAERNAAEATDPADKQMWADSAKLFRDNAAKLRESAGKLMEQMRANFEKFRQNCAPDAVEKPVTFVIQRDVERVEEESRTGSVERDRRQQQRLQERENSPRTTVEKRKQEQRWQEREKSPKATVEKRKQKTRTAEGDGRRDKRKDKSSNKHRNRPDLVQKINAKQHYAGGENVSVRRDRQHSGIGKMKSKHVSGHSRKLRKHRKGMEMNVGGLMMGF